MDIHVVYSSSILNIDAVFTHKSFIFIETIFLGCPKFTNTLYKSNYFWIGDLV